MPHKYLPVGQTVNHYSYKDVLEGLRGKETVAKERSCGSTNGICHSALSVKQFFTQKIVTYPIRQISFIVNFYVYKTIFS
jgi:hypothetical protein